MDFSRATNFLLVTPLKGTLVAVVSGALLCVIDLPAMGQTAASENVQTVQLASHKNRPIEFDVVSVKPSQSSGGWMSTFTEDGYIGEGVPVWYFIWEAFYPMVVHSDISGAPKWLDDRYEIRAKVAGEDVPAYKALTREQRDMMLQKILADRFQFRFEYGTVNRQVYELTLIGSDEKLAKFRAAEGYIGKGYSGRSYRDHDEMGFNAWPDQMEGLARSLSRTEDVAQKIVVDRTGLTGFYNINIWWCPLEDVSATEPSRCSGPTLATALKEQLGLQLKPGKVDMPTVVITHIEKPKPD